MASSKLALSRARASFKARQESWERKAVGVVASATAGYAEQAGVLPIEVMGVPSKLALGIITGLIAANASGTIGRMANATSESLMSIYAFEAAKTRSWVAGGGLPGAAYGMGEV